MNLDFKILEKSKGKRLKFEVDYILENGKTFTDVFYANLREVNVDTIIVEELLIVVDDNFKEDFISQKRKLKKNHFKISPEIPLNG